MLKDLTDTSLIRLNIEADDWQTAIRKAAQPLVDHKKVKAAYVDEIINGVLEMGPYIVITKHVALPHAKTRSWRARKCDWYCYIETSSEVWQ